jgi:arylsulfatase A-like enzyme
MLSMRTVAKLVGVEYKGGVNRVLVLLLGLVSVLSPVSAQERPNVMLIIVDDLNDWVGCLGGHPDALTPHIDSLAARGSLFVNAHCQAPICGPSRASFLSGLYPSSTGVYGQPTSRLGKDRALFVGHLLPQHFAAHGYRTFGVGKVTHGIPLKAVVDVAGPSGNSGPKPPEKHRFHYRPDESSPYSGTQTDWGAFPEREDQMPDFTTASWAIERLKVMDKAPFFMAVGFHRPHVPFYVPQRWFDKFPLESVTLPEIQEGDLDDVPAIGRAIHEVPLFPQLPFLQANDNEQWRRCVQAYLACTAFVDDQVGRVLKEVPENTIVALISDHGYHLGEKNRVAKHSLWPEATRVPMVIVPSVGARSQTIDQPVGLIDLFPTLCDLAGVAPKEGLEGLSLVPLLKDPRAAWPRLAVRTTYARGNHSLRSKSAHFVHYEDGSEEFYDMSRDPNIWNNMAATTDRNKLETFRKLLPEEEVPYHSASSPRPVNAWFESHFKREIRKQ